jgi:hypothetical protein
MVHDSLNSKPKAKLFRAKPLENKLDRKMKDRNIKGKRQKAKAMDKIILDKMIKT